MIFSIYLYKELYLHISSYTVPWSLQNLPFQQNPLKKPLTKLRFSDVAGLKPITLLKNESIYIESFSAVILEIYLLRNSSKQRHVKVQPFIC